MKCVDFNNKYLQLVDNLQEKQFKWKNIWPAAVSVQSLNKQAWAWANYSVYKWSALRNTKSKYKYTNILIFFFIEYQIISFIWESKCTVTSQPHPL